MSETKDQGDSLASHIIIAGPIIFPICLHVVKGWYTWLNHQEPETIVAFFAREADAKAFPTKDIPKDIQAFQTIEGRERELAAKWN